MSLAMLLGGVCLAILLRCAPSPAAAEADHAPLSVSIFVSSRKDLCFDPGDVAAIQRLAIAEQDRINTNGGILRRQLKIEVLDDERLPERTIANVKKALAIPQTVAMIGLSATDRAEKTFNALGGEIGASGIPFLSDISLNGIFEKQANVFTMRPSQEDERIPVVAQFIRARKVQRPAFVGLNDVPFSSRLGDGLSSLDDVGLVADHRLSLHDDELDPAAIDVVVADLKQKNPDLVFLALGSRAAAPVIAAFVAAEFKPPLFVTGRIEALLEAGAPEYPGDIFQLAWEDLPDVFSDRLRQRIARNGLDRWIFEGAKIAEAPGWASGECKPRPPAVVPDVFDRDNMRAIGRGTQYADMLALIAEALNSADPKSDTTGLRRHLLTQLKTTYAAGRGAFRGSFENWSFRPVSRAADRTPFIIMRPNGLGASQLAPEQFVRLRTEKLRQIDTLYLDIDLIRTFRVDDNDKSFFAEFYLSMRGKNASISQIEFANGFLDPKTNDRQINIRTLHDGGPSEIYPDQMKIYLVSGKFMFEPQLANYPFDTQRFPINIQPKSGDAPFIIQPPPHSLRDKAVTADGWDPKEQYVAYDDDFVPTIDAWTLRQSTVPYYKASFVWLMKRQTTDYYLRVVVPLAFILIVAYLSIFIPQSHFEAIVTIQVTALLSSVALYLALPKLDADSTTLSDRIFLFMYLAISLMIGISILRISRSVVHTRRLGKTLGFMHFVLIPALVAGAAFYVYRASLGHG
ncbi:MAG TPA: ABC transporter substrate-binding protein [Hyphomicrobiaceae bacterium]|nr:ABC transporter substrate-binding protein [Hyphomicrobiaceae bacterium]